MSHHFYSSYWFFCFYFCFAFFRSYANLFCSFMYSSLSSFFSIYLRWFLCLLLSIWLFQLYNPFSSRLQYSQKYFFHYWRDYFLPSAENSFYDYNIDPKPFSIIVSTIFIALLAIWLSNRVMTSVFSYPCWLNSKAKKCDLF